MADTGDERRLAPEALEALGLQRQPFDGVPPVPPDEDDETRVNLALGVLDARATPLLVSGQPGSGRTHFLEQVRAAAEMLTAAVVDARVEDPATALVAAGSRRGPQAVLVDNADALDSASLDALLRHARQLDCGLAMATEERAAEGLAQHVQDTLELAEPPPVLRLPPFSEQKTRIHVDHRITAAGGSPSRLLRPADYRRIHRVSEGLPGRIDTAAAAVLRARARRGGAGGGLLGGHRRTLLLAGGALALAALSLNVLGPFGGEETVTFEDTSDRETVAIDITRNDGDEADAEGAADWEGADALTNTDGEPTASGSELSADEPIVSDDPVPDAPPEAEPLDVWTLPDPLAGLAETEGDAAEAAEVAPDAGGSEGSAGADVATTVETDDAAAAADGSSGEVEDVARAAEETPESEAADTAAGSADTGDAGEAPAAPADDNDWFATRPADHYTIQLLAARQMSTVERFLGQNPEIADEVRVVRGERDGGEWYRLFLGDYAEREAARAALAALPEGARSAGAWTPTFGSVRGG